MKEDFLFDISLSNARTQLQHQKTIKKTLNAPKNVISYMCRMNQRLDMGHSSFCLWNVIFTGDSVKIIHNFIFIRIINFSDFDSHTDPQYSELKLLKGTLMQI